MVCWKEYIAIVVAYTKLVNDDVSNFPYFKRLSLATINTIRFYIIVSMIINLMVVVMSVLGLLNSITRASVHNVG